MTTVRGVGYSALSNFYHHVFFFSRWIYPRLNKRGLCGLVWFGLVCSIYHHEFPLIVHLMESILNQLGQDSRDWEYCGAQLQGVGHI